MAKTADKNNPTPGMYKPSCGDSECVIHKGADFPSCPKCKKPVFWTLIAPTESVEQ